LSIFDIGYELKGLHESSSQLQNRAVVNHRNSLT